MAEELLEKPIYINILIRRKDMAKALEEAKRKTGISVSTILIKSLIWNKSKE